MTRQRVGLRRFFGLCGGAIAALLLAGGLVSCMGEGDRPSSPSATSPKTMQLDSPAFSKNGFIPANHTCDGDNISPALSWDAPPPQTLSLALVVDDPDAPGTFVHWVLYDLPPNTRQLPEQLTPQPFLESGGLQGKTDFGKYGYGGPCPPTGTHRYRFRLYALDQVMDLPPGATEADLTAAMQGHILASAELTGKYTRQK